MPWTIYPTVKLWIYLWILIYNYKCCEAGIWLDNLNMFPMYITEYTRHCLLCIWLTSSTVERPVPWICLTCLVAVCNIPDTVAYDQTPWPMYLTGRHRVSLTGRHRVSPTGIHRVSVTGIHRVSVTGIHRVSVTGRHRVSVTGRHRALCITLHEWGGFWQGKVGWLPCERF